MMTKPIFFSQKYSSNGSVAEAVITGGEAFFIVKSNEGKITMQKSVELADRILLPPASHMYLSKPYEFRTKEEVFECMTKARCENIDSLFRRIRTICSKYIDASNEHCNLVSASIIYTYFQDRLGLTYYLFFVGHPGSGKSNNLHFIHNLGYRNFMGTDITSANIYQYLGSIQEGQGTICEDEADNIGHDRVKMRIYKEGYLSGFRIPRTDISRGRRQESFYAFGFKAFAAEQLPDAYYAMGFIDRLIVLKCINGTPKHDIQEIVNPAGDKKLRSLMDEIDQQRKLLLAYRVLHFKDAIPDIKVNITNREKQLFKPLMRIFYGTESFPEIRAVVTAFLMQRREATNNSWYAFLLTIIKDMMKNMKTNQLPSKLIWTTIIDELPEGERKGEMTYRSERFGAITEKHTVDTLMSVFGAKHARRHGQQRKLIFSEKVLDRIALRYTFDSNFILQVSKPNGTDGT